MSESLDEIFDKIAADAIADTQRKFEEAARATIEEAFAIATKQFEGISEYAIGDFYASYTPKTPVTINNNPKFYKDGKHIKTGKRGSHWGYTGRNYSMFNIIQVSSNEDSIMVDEIEENISPWATGGHQASFDAAYVHGIHGHSNNGVSTPPEEIFDNASGAYWEGPFTDVLDKILNEQLIINGLAE